MVAKAKHTRSRVQKDLTKILETSIEVLNSINSKILTNKLATTTSNLIKLKQPLESSLLALSTSQWQVSKVLPE